MKKRILTMLLALVMILSVVPMMAMAAECTNHGNGSYAYPAATNGYHIWACGECNEPMDGQETPCYDDNGDGTCDYCFASIPVVNRCDKHGEQTYAYPADNGTHVWKCSFCAENMDDAAVPCVDGVEDAISGICDYCMANMPKAECAHSWWTTDLGDGTHQMICIVCGDTNGDPAAHVYEHGVCIGCSREETCIHNWWTKDLGDSHQMVCQLCGVPHPEYGKVEEHQFENGFCIDCSHEQKCEHTWWTFDLGNGTHQQKCSKCGEPHPEYGQVEKHEFENGVCIDCSAEQVGNARPPYHRPHDGKHDNVPGTGGILSMIVGFIQNLF